MSHLRSEVRENLEIHPLLCKLALLVLEIWLLTINPLIRGNYHDLMGQIQSRVKLDVKIISEFGAQGRIGGFHMLHPCLRGLLLVG